MTEPSKYLWGTGSASPTYITRPAIANERLATDERGQVVHTFKQPFRDGSTHTVLEPLDIRSYLPPGRFRMVFLPMRDALTGRERRDPVQWTLRDPP